MPQGSLDPPFDVVLARSVKQIPTEDALPGGSRYEPKWDGFRVVLHVDADGLPTVWSRQRKDLTRQFPDLCAAAAETIPPGFAIDGEAVVWTDEQLNFEALQRRLTASSRGFAAHVREHPASFAAFDVLVIAGQDARSLRFDDRRALLEELAEGWDPPLHLSPLTPDVDTARGWFEDSAGAGIEGLVVKGGGQKYRGGERDWAKVKRRQTLDVICAAITGSVTAPSALLIGLPIDGDLKLVGQTTGLKGSDHRALRDLVRPATAGHPWPASARQGSYSRWNKAERPAEITLVEPFVVEISADAAWTGNQFRHSVRFIRARPEIVPATVELPGNLR